MNSNLKYLHTLANQAWLNGYYDLALQIDEWISLAK